MSARVLEILRANAELTERAILVFGEELDHKPSGQRGKVEQQHHLNDLIHKVQNLSSETESMLTDADGRLEDELTSMRTPDPLSAFYQALAASEEFFSTASTSAAASAAAHGDFLPLIEGSAAVPALAPQTEWSTQFSGEEVYGKYLDLHSLYSTYVNLVRPSNTATTDFSTTTTPPLEYLEYLERFTTFNDLPQSILHSRHFVSYLGELWSYMTGFHQRIQPLISLNPFIREWISEFEAQNDRRPVSTSSSLLNLEGFSSAEALEVLGAERLKEDLELRGLKCGGTLKDRAARLWSIRGLAEEAIPGSLRAKGARKMPGNDNTTESKHIVEEDSLLTTAKAFHNLSLSERSRLLQYLIATMGAVMGDTIRATRRHAEKQQSLSLEEKAAEILEEELGRLPDVIADEESGDDEPVYNPLNLPIGWDGKPIPLWLYKLHGLGVEYRCELCGGHSYWGRRAFDKHFGEARHIAGLRAIGVVNTRPFHDITSISAAIELNEKLTAEATSEVFVSSAHEEFEDTLGNVLDRRTYEDLARQGLL